MGKTVKVDSALRQLAVRATERRRGMGAGGLAAARPGGFQTHTAPDRRRSD
ncbi:hypothetical protein FRAHR75_370046 [Frankia sp. Hr75.2]|nr:hypothetical protein FRAHR75_370046 [Frankia sp. Hr75.2]SQD97977.1 hypothetical protein FMEAI12_4420015 [Parafrankia sp. Ea1.12]